MRHLPLVYAMVILCELVGLSWLYATDPPASSSKFSITLGWIAIASMVVMLIYSVARRSRALRRVARLSVWLHFHIFLGVQGVMFALFHSSHVVGRLGSLNLLNPALLNVGVVLIVFCSGLFGRYLYSFLPRTISGDRMALGEVEAELKGAGPLPEPVAALTKGAAPANGLVDLVRADLRTRAALRDVKKLGLAPEVASLAERRLRLERRLAALAGADRVFQRWIVLHRPLAAIMFVLTLVHIALSYMYTPSLGN